MIKIKFTHITGNWIDTNNLFIDVNGKVNELTDNGFLIARSDIKFHMVSDIKNPSKAVSHAGVDTYRW